MKINKIIPELLIEDMKKSIDFYKNVLGFEVEISFPEKNPIFAQIVKDNASVMLYLRSDFEKEIPHLVDMKMGGSVLLYFKITGIEEFYFVIKDRVNVIQKLHSTDYGSKEFSMEDCNGYLLAFSE